MYFHRVPMPIVEQNLFSKRSNKYDFASTMEDYNEDSGKGAMQVYSLNFGELTKLPTLWESMSV